MELLKNIYDVIKTLHNLEAEGYGIYYLHTNEYFLYNLGGKGLYAYSTIQIADPEASKKIIEIYTALTEILRGKRLITWKGNFYPNQDNSIDIIL